MKFLLVQGMKVIIHDFLKISAVVGPPKMQGLIVQLVYIYLKPFFLTTAAHFNTDSSSPAASAVSSSVKALLAPSHIQFQ